MLSDSDQKTVAAAILRGQESAGSLKEIIDPTLSVHVDTILDSFSTCLSLLASSSHRSNKKRKSFGEEELVQDSPTLIIKNSLHQRNYYRCWERNCKARKHVQKIQNSPPIFRTTYVGLHTCQTQGFLHSAQNNGSSRIIQFDQALNKDQETNQVTNQEYGDDQDFLLKNDKFWDSDELKMMFSHNDFDLDRFQI